jgi:hypothetical protein
MIDRANHNRSGRSVDAKTVPAFVRSASGTRRTDGDGASLPGYVAWSHIQTFEIPLGQRDAITITWHSVSAFELRLAEALWSCTIYEPLPQPYENRMDFKTFY